MFWTIEDVKKPPSRRDPQGVEQLPASRHSIAGIAALARILFGYAKSIYLEHFPPKWAPVRRRKCD